MVSANRPSVLLLHDQLLDARVWRGFADRLAGHAEVLTVTAPTPAEFRGRPREWAADLETAVRPALAAYGPVDLALGAGWAIGAALSLLERGAARRVLLVNPWPPAAVFEALPDVADLSDEERRRFAPPPDRPEVPAPDGAVVEQIDDEGVVRAEAMKYLLEVAWESDCMDVLDEADRLAVKQIQTEAFSWLLPLALAPLRDTSTADEPDWMGRAAALASRCTVALGSTVLARVRELLAERTPALVVIDLPTVTPFPWLEDPEQMDAVVREVLGR